MDVYAGGGLICTNRRVAIAELWGRNVLLKENIDDILYKVHSRHQDMEKVLLFLQACPNWSQAMS